MCMILFTQERIFPDSDSWPGASCQSVLHDNIPHSNYVHHLCCVCWHWWRAHSEESLHHPLSADCPQTNHSPFLHSEHIGYGRRQSSNC